MKGMLIPLMLAVAVFCAACAPNYSEGTRVGVVTKLSKKGLIFKSWEGTMLIALPNSIASATQPESFDFNVDEQCVDKVKKAMIDGKRVELVYRQWAVCPPTIESDYVVVDVK